MRARTLTALMLLVIAAGCSRPGDAEQSQVSATITETLAGLTATPAQTSKASTPSPGATAVAADAFLATRTQQTATPRPAETALPPTVTPSATPTPRPRPPLGVVEQPPYAASDCSDKYPCNEDVAAWTERIRVPAGFQVDYFARLDDQPTTMAFGSDGLLYVATMDGEILTIDEDGAVSTYADGFLVPTGLAFHPDTGALYVASRVEDVSEGGESAIYILEENGLRRPIIRDLPCCYSGMHAANGIVFGPDGFGYVGVGARADHGEVLSGPRAGEKDELQPLEASVVRFRPSGSRVSAYATGLRNAYDIAFDAEGRLWATDNAPDHGPPDEFHQVLPGRNHGYPWYVCDECFAPPAEIDVVPPVFEFPPHSSPTGITSYLANSFPGYYNSLFVTLWSAFPEAQRVVWFAPGAVETATFATGFAAPIDVVVGPAGNLYVADWATGIIFKISYVEP